MSTLDSPTVANIEASVDWMDTTGLALQIDGNDLVHVTDIDEDGTALVRVFGSTHPEAPVLFEGTVNVLAHGNTTEPPIL